MESAHTTRFGQPTALITGASRGLGYALCKTLLEAGWNVAICAQNEERLEAAADSLKSTGAAGALTALAGDVTDGALRTALMDTALRRYGRLDVLANNASTLGQIPMPTILAMGAQDVSQVFAVNTLAPLRLMQLGYPHLRKSPIATVINISSDAAIGGYERWGAYGASKAALDLLSKTAAAEWRAQGVRVYAVDPGDMDTDMHRAALPDDTDAMADPAIVAAAIASLLTGAAPPTAVRLRIVNGKIMES